METTTFTQSLEGSLGIELELQILDPSSHNLIAVAAELIKQIENSDYANQITSEVTQGMIEINSSICQSATELLANLREIKHFLLQKAVALDIFFSGGGTHPFQAWHHQKICATKRARKLSNHYGYLAKQFTVFGQHIHIGCANGDQAINLIHHFARYVPHLIALSASSPFYEGIDTNFECSRLNVINTFPTSGHLPPITNWKKFSAYFQQLCDLKIIESMKDIYWDIRPKAQFGTIEIRICDTPLTINTAVMLASYAQTIVHYLLENQQKICQPCDPMLYNYNRYQACRYGFKGDFIDPTTFKHRTLQEEILNTVATIKPHIKNPADIAFILQVEENARAQKNDARWLRRAYNDSHSFQSVASQQSQLWMGS